MKECTTHHNACDCREKATRKLVNDLLRDAAFKGVACDYDRLRADAVRLGYVQGQAGKQAAQGKGAQ